MRASRTLFLLLVVAGLGAWIWFHERHGLTAEERRERMRLAFDLPVERIVRLGIRTPGYDVTVFRSGKGWELAAPEGARANDALVKQTLARLRNLKRGELITPADMRERGQTLADFGLAVPGLVLHLETTTESREYRIGDPNPLGNALYVKEEDTQNVMVVSSDLMDILPEDPNAFRDRDLIPLNLAEASSLTLVRTNGMLRLERNGDDWRIVEPRTAPADLERVADLVQKLGVARIEGMVNEPDPSVDYGLGAAAERIRVRTPSVEIPYEISLGADVPGQPDLCYAELSGVEGLVWVSKGLRSLARTDLAALRDRRLLLLETPDIAAVEIDGPERALRIGRTNEVWRVTAPIQKTASASRVRRMIQYWRDARVEAFLTPDPDAGVQYEVRFLPVEGEPRVFQVLRDQPEDGRALLRRPGDDEVLRVVPDLVAYSPVEAIPYLSRRMLSLEPERVVRISRESPRGGSEVVRDSGTAEWRASDEGRAIRPEALEGLLAVLSDLRAADVLAVNPPSLEPFGLESPPYRLSVGVGGETPTSRTLLLNPSEDGATAVLQGEEVVFRVSLGQWNVLRKPFVEPGPDGERGPETPDGRTP